MAEHRAQAGLVVDHETLRRWSLATGKWDGAPPPAKASAIDQRTTTKKRGHSLLS
jgi:hypothetical protein